MHLGNLGKLEGYFERSFPTLLHLTAMHTRFVNIFIFISLGLNINICRSIWLLVISSNATQIFWNLLISPMTLSHGCGVKHQFWHSFQKHASHWVERQRHQVSFVLSSLDGLHTILHTAGWSIFAMCSRQLLQMMLEEPNMILLQSLSLGIQLQKLRQSGWSRQLPTMNSGILLSCNVIHYQLIHHTNYSSESNATWNLLQLQQMSPSLLSVDWMRFS